jgi:hypothetical protein
VLTSLQQWDQMYKTATVVELEGDESEALRMALVRKGGEKQVVDEVMLRVQGYIIEAHLAPILN